MPANKNQHFVPRCYLRPFSRAAEAKAINLFNVDSARAIANAAVKGQCSGDYFYGEDQILERRLTQFEGEYARCLAAVSSDGFRLTADHAATLRQFWLLQHMRTEAASLTVVRMMQQMDKDLGGLPPGYKLDIKEAVRTAMLIFFLEPPEISDLDVRLVRNRSALPFITSDNPAVLTNRFHLTAGWTAGISPGMGNAGTVGLLPLSPNILLLIFDRDVHYVKHQFGWIDLERAADADAFNQHQVLNCNANLYFDAWNDRQVVADLVQRLVPNKPAEHFRNEYGVLDHVEEGRQVYRIVAAEEVKGREGFIHTSKVTPAPLTWPSILSWRAGGTVYVSGTGEGIVRNATRSNGFTYTKRRIHR
jgi:hypothetical protein